MFLSGISYPMSTNLPILVWNVCGLNDRTMRSMVRNLVLFYAPSIVCL